ncbi:MAG: prepilin-type N-terminal cleavage/methylation domain-containing protein [Planctomycetota bacterium]
MPVTMPAMRHHPRPPRRRRPAGFTLIELLVVIGIIALLTVALVVGLSGSSESARKRATNITLEKLRTMTDETERAVGNGFVGLRNGTIGVRFNALFDTNGDLIGFDSVVVDVDGSDSIDPTIAVGDSAVYMTLEPIEDTLAVMASLAAVPANSDVIAALDTAERFPLTDLLPQMDDTALQTAIAGKALLVSDAWGFPILFAPGTGDPANLAGGIFVDLNDPATPGVDSDDTPVVAANGKGFWVSPGPDGLYATHQDNVYSTEVKVLP